MTQKEHLNRGATHGLAPLSILLAACLAFGGCGLFDPRDPEEPGGDGVQWIAPTAPETLFVDIKNSMEGKVILNFERCFVDTGFAFHPDPSDSLDLLSSLSGRDVFLGWNLDAELAVAQRIFDESGTIKLTFTTRDTMVSVSIDERIYFFKYELQVLGKVGGAEMFRGFVDFDVRSVGGLWYVSMWLDKRDPDYPYPTYRTWGYFKGTKR